MKKDWNVTDSNGTVHHVQCSMGSFGGKVIIDNDQYKIKSSNWFIIVVDYQINLPGIVCNLVIVGNSMKLAVNGVYMDDGKPYEPVNNIPFWIWICVAVSCVGGFFFSGIGGLCVGLIFSIFAVKAILDKKTGIAVILFVLSIVLELALMFLYISIRTNIL